MYVTDLMGGTDSPELRHEGVNTPDALAAAPQYCCKPHWGTGAYVRYQR